jgi:transcriptional regulator with XRE-family HTH domain
MTITGQQVKAARALLDWTQDKLAVEIRVSPSITGHFETGKRRPSMRIVSTLQRALEATGVTFVEENGEGSNVRLRTGKPWPAFDGGSRLPRSASPYDYNGARIEVKGSSAASAAAHWREAARDMGNW